MNEYNDGLIMEFEMNIFGFMHLIIIEIKLVPISYKASRYTCNSRECHLFRLNSVLKVARFHIKWPNSVIPWAQALSRNFVFLSFLIFGAALNTRIYCPLSS